MEEDTKNWIFGIGFAIVFCMVIIIAADAGGKNVNKRNRETYKHWCEFNHRQDVPFEQWSDLYRHGLLPGQNTK